MRLILPRHWYSRIWFVVVIAALLGLLWVEQQGKQAQHELSAADFRPQFTPPQGFYNHDLSVKISVPSPDTELIVTTDGRVPTLDVGARYVGGGVRISAETPPTILKARAILPTGELGPLTQATYFTQYSTLPSVSVVIEPHDLWDKESGIFANLAGRGREWERPAHLTLLDQNKIVAETIAGVRVHGNSSRGYEKKSLRLYFRDEYGLDALNYALLPTLPNQIANDRYTRLVLYNGGQDFGRPDATLLRTLVTNRLVAELESSLAAASRPVLMYLNGEPQGIYLVRNRPDEDYFRDAYRLPILSEANAVARWAAFQTELATLDLSQPEAYAYVSSQIDVDNFIDHFLLQMYIANTDWIFYNMVRVRTATEWKWVFWDLDWTWGLAHWSDESFDTFAWLAKNSDKSNFQRGSLLLNKLLENAEFRAAFEARMLELSETVLAPQRVVAAIDASANELRPYIEHETDRWHSPTEWELSVEAMREFARTRPNYFQQSIHNHLATLQE